MVGRIWTTKLNYQMTYLTIFNLFTFSTLLAIGVLLFLGFMIYRRFRMPAVVLKRDRYKHEQKIQKIEFVVWAIYFLMIIYVALTGNLVVTIIVLLLLILAFFKFWKNYFAGIVIKFTNKFEIGDSITINSLKGNIIEMGFTSLILATAEGTEVILPYSSLDTQIKIEQKSSPKILSKSMYIPDFYLRTSDQKSELLKLLSANPWIILSKPIQLSTDEKGTNLSFFVINNEIYNKAVYWIQDRIETMINKESSS